jgi:hypothetical protein
MTVTSFTLDHSTPILLQKFPRNESKNNWNTVILNGTTRYIFLQNRSIIYFDTDHLLCICMQLKILIYLFASFYNSNVTLALAYFNMEF